MEVRTLSWNLFHGRDHPPEPELRTWRSRLFRVTERGASHAQVNRDLFEQFAGTLSAANWDLALLQECPPRWAEALAIRCDADAHLVLTSRNPPLLGPLQGLVADHNPDLIASWEGGSNVTLVRATAPAIRERLRHRLTLRPERRVMAFTRLANGLCVANLHASAERGAAEHEVPLAARVASRWTGDAPLILGGDFNLRPALSPAVFAVLEGELGFSAATGPKVIDHLLARGARVVEAPRQWPPERRESPDPTATADPALPIRLSDHAPVEALFAT